MNSNIMFCPSHVPVRSCTDDRWPLQESSRYTACIPCAPCTRVFENHAIRNIGNLISEKTWMGLFLGVVGILGDGR